MAEPIAASIAESSASTPELDAWMQLTHLILAAVSDHAVRIGEMDADSFRQRIQDSASALKSRPAPAQVLIMAGALSQTIANYSGQTQRRIDAALAPVPSAAGNRDGCTGLPDRTKAEAAIARALAASGESLAQTCVAAFYLHRTNLANARFGTAVGDQLLSFCSQQITASIIKTSDSLYRWSGPAFIAILRRESQTRLNDEVQRAASAPVSRFFETASRTVYLPIKLTGRVIRTGNQTCAEVIEQIERFMNEAAGATGTG
ncbi:MAG: diguanylate cyclase domain-containing protein [Bryobacteraceae bacterium]